MQTGQVNVPLGDDLIINEQNMAYKMDSGLGERARIGLIVLSSDQTIEHELRQILDLPGVSFYTNRIYCAPTITPETLKEMENKIPEATRLIMPGLPLDVIAYGCTSGSMLIGIENVYRRIHEARPEVACTAPMQAVAAAFQALASRSIALITPYIMGRPLGSPGDNEEQRNILLAALDLLENAKAGGSILNYTALQ